MLGCRAPRRLLAMSIPHQSSALYATKGLFMLKVSLLALGLSADVFSASIALGGGYSFTLLHRVGIAVGYGLIGAMAPLIGYFSSQALRSSIASFDHWIVFVILGFLGARIIWRGFHASYSSDYVNKPSFLVIVTTGFATSLDNIVAGFALPFLYVDVPIALGAVGLLTSIMTLIGLGLGRANGDFIGKWAGLAGGAGLIFIGSNVLYLLNQL